MIPEGPMPRPRLFVISAPSGSGKTTIAREILKRHPEILFSISATTRTKRAHEIDGKDYFFISKEEFGAKIKNDELVEWEEIYGDYYGSLKREVTNALAGNRSLLFDVDVKGALTIKKKYPADAVLIFIQPPNIEVLTQRLMGRKTEDKTTIQRRLERVPMELNMEKEFDYCVVNDKLQQAVDSVDSIISKESNVPAERL